MSQAAKKKSKSKRNVSKQNGGFVGRLSLIFLLILAIVFLPSAVLLMIGLLPLFVVSLTEGGKKKARIISIGSMNIAGCMPFLMTLWISGGSMNAAVSLLMDPLTITVMYGAAAIGYIIDWGVTLITSDLLYKRGLSRMDAIQKQQDAMIERWGEKVSGKIPLDHEGFPLVSHVPEEEAVDALLEGGEERV